MQPRGVDEGEFAEVIFGHVAPLHQLERFRQDFAEIGHVEVGEVGAEHGTQSHAHAWIECHDGRAIVGFAAETQDVLKNAEAKLTKKGADFIVANDVGPSGTSSGGVMGGDRGGPNFATHVMSYHIFKTAITNQYEGLGSAYAAIFFCIMVVIGYVQYRFLRVRYEY